ncbi:unnamed protein product, partial [Discosporangium mesarthrocarpum]
MDEDNLLHAPGEAPTTFAKKPGVVSSQITYLEVTDQDNEWVQMESTATDHSSPVVCEFNPRGQYLAMGLDVGQVEVWSFIGIPSIVRTLQLPPSVASWHHHHRHRDRIGD